MINILVTGRGEKITSRDRKHAEEKIHKLEKYFNGMTRIEIILQMVAEMGEVELVISVKRGSQIVCHARDKDLYAAVDLVLDKAEIQLTRHKEKIRHRRTGREGAEVPGGAGGDTEEEQLEAYEDIVEKREFGAEEDGKS